MCVERFHISKIVLLTCRTWLINHSSRTLYTVFQPSNPELSKFILCKAYMDDCVLECRQWPACSWSPIAYSWRPPGDLQLHGGPLWGAISTTTITRGTWLSSNKSGLKRLHSWSRMSSQTDTCVKGQTSTPPPQSSTVHILLFKFLKSWLQMPFAEVAWAESSLFLCPLPTASELSFAAHALAEIIA